VTGRSPDVSLTAWRLYFLADSIQSAEALQMGQLVAGDGGDLDLTGNSE